MAAPTAARVPLRPNDYAAAARPAPDLLLCAVPSELYGDAGMTRGATLFSGGGGVEALLKERIDFVHAVEYDPKIAEVYRINHGDHIQVAKVEDVDYSLWGALDYGHASTVCKEFSNSNVPGQESSLDIKCAMAVCRFLRCCRPRVFTLENVPAYVKSESFRRIIHTLTDLGYMSAAEIVNSADYGVPQTRRRLIVRAVRDALLPGLPDAQPWRGWYDAIKHTLEPSTPTPYQIRRIGTTTGIAFVDTNNDSRPATVRRAHEPAPTIPSSWWRRRVSQGVWIVNGAMGHITPRNGAQLQSVPDWYALPNDTRLAGEIIGNMVPSLMMQKIVEPLL